MGRNHPETGRKGGAERGAGPALRSGPTRVKRVFPRGERPRPQAEHPSLDSQSWQKLPLQQPAVGPLAARERNHPETKPLF